MNTPPDLAHAPDHGFIDGIRASSRQMVRELGFLHGTLAATDYPPSAVHALMEIGARQSMTASDVTAFLGLEKSSVSRMLRKLVDAGELEEAARPADARIKDLSLTRKGRKSRAAIEAYGRHQVSSALANLQPAEQEAVRTGLALYSAALARRRQAPVPATPDAAPAVDVVAGYRPGVLGRIAEMHAVFYARHAGFGAVFESRVAAGLAEFAGRLPSGRNQVWTAVQAGRIVGSVAIDGEDLGDGRAHLRWFIVGDGVRGGGVGRALLRQAVDFCDRGGFSETHLWTFRGLDAARHLYERHGFVLATETPGAQWGTPVLEQSFVRRAVAAG
ncbi:helix-turn-helix domain-containing GNAT family N-acetyltransferase [Xylophilus sp. Leaf220]|uniref:helix-turn-helix domain-containing GNAT family N-acetyltransferase n=1 Tax=Xylophilus sp. Leaf220 TaxID=1735686 RepID=UPI0006F6C559|nr:helix-turn-helix domain-containing GNAT family N-acetyltransferase [Xylophilus sp. Leaf220]KQM68470.1 MarR family transcriptional regulator [Xylophilus sp. Leaf220]